MAHQREVVGDVAGAGAGVIITELNIETPVQTILDLPVTSDCLRDPLGVGGQAAAVAHALGAGAIAHRSDAFDHGEAGYVLPGGGVVKPIDGIVGAAATHFDPAVPGARALVGRSRTQRAAWVEVGEDDRVVQVAVVVFHTQHVVRTSFGHLE